MPRFFQVAFVLLWSVLVIYWSLRLWGNKKTVYRFNSGWRLLILGCLLVYGIWGKSHDLPPTLTRRIVSSTPLQLWSALIFCALGLIIALWARRTLGSNWSGNPTLKEGHELITGGPYRWVRHPIYSGLLLMTVGTVWAHGRLIDLIFLVLGSVLVGIKIHIEEGLMLRQFPDQYRSYQERTKTVIPFVL